MLTYLLKSGVCLAVFYLFYKLLLEKEPIHIFKRIYLLGGLLLAFAIPLITFTTTVQVEPFVMDPINYSEVAFEPLPMMEAKVATITYWPIILWTVYGFGVVLFGLKFLFNLYQIGSKIRKHPNQKVNGLTHVLLQHLITPHTFFSYIFLNKRQYEQHKIPQEVFWHEETHAKQKHSLDVVLVELLQVVFWFNPLFYFIKKDIKLNHEFLADRAVLNKGVSLTAYQEILLAFSTNQTEPQLANALNYSSIKKRFTIMKTKTSKKAVWIKSLVLLPLVAVLIYGFSEKTTIEKVVEPLTELENLTIVKDDIRIYISKNKKVTINNKPIDFNAISTELIKISKGISNINPKISIEIEGHLSNTFLDNLEKEVSKSKLPIYEIKSTTMMINEGNEQSFFKGTMFTADSLVFNLKNGENIVGVSKPNKLNQNDINQQQDTTKDNYIAQLVLKYNTLKAKQNASNSKADSKKLSEQLELLESRINKKLEEITNSANIKLQDKATPKELAEYNKLAKHYNSMSKSNMVVKLKDVERLKFIYNKMTHKQKKNAESFPNFPPPPPPVKTSDKVVVGKLIPPPPPIPANATPEQKEKYNQAIENYNRQIGYTYKTESWKHVKVIEGKLISPPPPIPQDATPEEKAKMLKAIKKYAKENPDKVYKHEDKNGKLVEIVEMPEVLKTNKNKSIILLENWYINIDGRKLYYPYKKGNLKKYYDKYGNEIVLDIVKEYQRKNAKYERLRNEGKHYIYKLEAKKKELEQLSSDLGGMYFRMSRTNKAKVKRPKNLYYPYLKITKSNGEIYYKKRSELTEEDKKLIPPPPPPPSKKKN